MGVAYRECQINSLWLCLEEPSDALGGRGVKGAFGGPNPVQNLRELIPKAALRGEVIGLQFLLAAQRREARRSDHDAPACTDALPDMRHLHMPELVQQDRLLFARRKDKK